MIYINKLDSDISGHFLTEFLPIGGFDKITVIQFIIDHRCEKFESLSAMDILETIKDIGDMVYDMQESEALGA